MVEDNVHTYIETYYRFVGDHEKIAHTHLQTFATLQKLKHRNIVKKVFHK